MATTPRVSENPTTQRNYVAQLTIAAALGHAIRELWAALQPTSSPAALQAFGSGARAVVTQFSQATVSVASDAYRSARVEAGVTSDLRLPRVTTTTVAPKVNHELDWITRQVQADVAELEAKILADAEATFQKIVADEARQWTVDAVEGDEKALGFRRVARPDACAWCLALAIRTTSQRGPAADFKRYGTPGSMGGDEHFGIYKSRESAGQLPPGATAEVNRFHFKCNCTVEPIFDTGLYAPTWLLDVRDLYDQTDDFNHFRRVIEALRRGEDARVNPLPVLPPSSTPPEQVAAIASLLAGLVG